MADDLAALFAISAIAAVVPIVVGLLRIKIAEVVLLIACGVVCGPDMLGLIQINDTVMLLSNIGLGMLFFVAGLELEQRSVRGRAGRLAAIGWLTSIALAFAIAMGLDGTGIIDNGAAVAIALTSTALGTLLPILRDAGELKSPFGTLFMGAGAWGEFGPIAAMSVLLSTKSPAAAVSTLIGFLAIGLLVGIIPHYFREGRLRDVIEVGNSKTSQTGVRLAMLLLVGLLSLAGRAGLDFALGAFIAGLIVHRYSASGEKSDIRRKMETIAFGLFIPLFFVVSGAKLDIWSIIDNPVPLLCFFALMLVARGAPQILIYRNVIPDLRQRTRFALLVATALPIIVAVTTVEVTAGVMESSTAAAMVGAGALSVLVFPLLGSALARGRGPTRVVGIEDVNQARAAKTA